MDPVIFCLASGKTESCGRREEEIVARSREFWRDNALFGVATVVSGLFNYLYHVVLAHVLGPREYGDLATFLNVTAFLVLPAPVVTLLYTRLGRRRGSHARRESWLLWAGGLAVWLALAACARPLGRLLLISPWLLVIFTGEVVPALALAANVGVLQRVRRYFLVGTLTVMITAFRVVAAGVAAFIRVWPLTVVGLLEGVAAFVAFLVSRRFVSRVAWTGEPSHADVISGTAVVGIINALLGITDGLMAKHFLPVLAAGLFNGLATIGHTVQYVSSSFGTVMLTSIMADPSRRRQFLGLTALVYALVAGSAEFLFSWDGRWVVFHVLGPHFLPVVAWLTYYGWGMIALGFINIAMLYSVALKRWEAIATTGMGLLVWVWRLSQAHTLGTFAEATTTTMVAAFAATVVVMAIVDLTGKSLRPLRGRVRL